MLLIKQAKIVDGRGSKPFLGDILINGSKISAIGKNFVKKKTDEVIDGLGLIVAPGFIDVTNDSDHYLSLFTNPAQKDLVAQGVTTVIGGQCGASLAPLIYGSLASLEQWSDTERINVDWISVSELKRVLGRVNPGVNFETLVGYSTVRRDIVGGPEIRDLTEPEIQIFLKILDKAMREGALGLSTGLGFLDSKFVPYSEIKKIVSFVAKHDGVYTTHLRNEKEELVRSVEEALMMSRDTGAKTVISHLRSFRGYEKQFEEALNLIDKSLVDSNIYFSTNPFTETIFPIYTYLPYWAQSEFVEVMIENIKDAEKRKLIIQELKKMNLEEMIVADARGQEVLIGKSLVELSMTRQKDIALVVLELMESTKMKARLMSKSLNSDVIISLLNHPRSLIGTNSASMPLRKNGGSLKMDRATSTFTKYIELLSTQGIPIESIVKKITSLPAQIFGLKERGTIKEGYFADLTLLKNGKVSGVIYNGKLNLLDN
ncbi:MAG: amidohydrolase family protein [Patescibacteria group bacterium]|nr:amidohydrolase family protein [Patescibacteria group bacterium]